MNVQELLRRYNIRPRKGFSQHFLLDEIVLREAVRFGQIRSNLPVLEIGAGIGNLTAELAKTGARVLAFEVDRRFEQLLRDRFGKRKNAQLVFEDFFRWFREHNATLPDEYIVAGNLPYQSTAHFFRTVLEARQKPSRIVVLVQKEVAERICAAPGAMSLLSLSVQLYARPTIIRKVPRTAFWPQPKVDSALLLLTEIQSPKSDLQSLFSLARIAFSGRRKQLANSLAAGLQKPPSAIVASLRTLNIKPTARPQELSVEEWKRIDRTLSFLL